VLKKLKNQEITVHEKYMKQDTNNITDIKQKHVDAIFQTMRDFHKIFYPKNFPVYFSIVKKLLKWFVGSIIVSIIVAIIFCLYKIRFNFNQTSVSITTLFNFIKITIIIYLDYILPILCIFYIILDIKRRKKNFCSFFETVKQEIDKKEIDFMSKIVEYPIETIVFVANRLEYGWEERFSFGDSVIGSIRTLGVIPQAAAFIYLFYNFYKFIPNNYKSMLISFVCVCIGFYIAEMFIVTSVNQTKRYTFLLRQAISLKRVKNLTL